MNTTKTCPGCRQEKALSEFGKDRSRTGGLSSYCQPCIRDKSKRVFASNPERYLEVRRERYKKSRTTPRYRASRLLSEARTRHPEVTVDLDWVDAQIATGICAVTGIPFDLSGRGAPAGPFTPSLDRISPLGGYTKGNTQVVCWIYNRAKGAGTHADVVRLVEALHRA